LVEAAQELLLVLVLGITVLLQVVVLVVAARQATGVRIPPMNLVQRALLARAIAGATQPSHSPTSVQAVVAVQGRKVWTTPVSVVVQPGAQEYLHP
jgi:hypothetical protein